MLMKVETIFTTAAATSQAWDDSLNKHIKIFHELDEMNWGFVNLKSLTSTQYIFELVYRFALDHYTTFVTFN
ncbi:hypothetical protein ACJX0J_008684 [Zea mays]